MFRWVTLVCSLLPFAVGLPTVPQNSNYGGLPVIPGGPERIFIPPPVIVDVKVPFSDPNKQSAYNAVPKPIGYANVQPPTVPKPVGYANVQPPAPKQTYSSAPKADSYANVPQLPPSSGYNQPAKVDSYANAIPSPPKQTSYNLASKSDGYAPPPADSYANVPQLPPSSGYNQPAKVDSYANAIPSPPKQTSYNLASKSDGYAAPPDDSYANVQPPSSGYGQQQPPEPTIEILPSPRDPVVIGYYSYNEPPPTSTWGKWWQWHFLKWNAPYYTVAGKKK